jgi:hypothetical protein
LSVQVFTGTGEKGFYCSLPNSKKKRKEKKERKEKKRKKERKKERAISYST